MSFPADTQGPLAAVLAWGGADLERLLQGVEAKLAQSVGGYGEALAEAAGSTLAAGGKRFRPLLVFVCGADGPYAQLIFGAVAVELVHMATLIHDDLIDGAPTRRGEPTVAATWGSQRALASGDFLLARAFSELAASGQDAAMTVLSGACLRLAQGELAQRHAIRDATITVASYLERCELKTASLFEAACRLGALAAQRSDAVVEALAEFGARIGLAFQILDDVLDIDGDPAKTGKAVGTDLREGTVTLPLILAGTKQARLIETALAVKTDEEVAAVCAAIGRSGALAESRASAQELVEEAKSVIPTAALGDDQAQILHRVADGVVERFA